MYNHLFDYTIPLRAIQEKLDKSQVSQIYFIPEFSREFNHLRDELNKCLKLA